MNTTEYLYASTMVANFERIPTNFVFWAFLTNYSRISRVVPANCFLGWLVGQLVGSKNEKRTKPTKSHG
jgi:hypothetical protein